jgi:sugar phosphate isomerase/epimerase
MPEQAGDLASAGYDFVEWPLNRTVGVMSDDEYARVRRLAAGLRLRPEAWNVMLPATIKVVGPDANDQALTTYVEAAFRRVADLGGEVVVFGSGGSRQVPDGFPPAEAHGQFEHACRIVGDVAAKHALTIAIEPLNRGETNLVNGVAEAVATANRVGHPAVRVLSDLYHVSMEDEPLSDTTNAGDMLAHVHVAAPDRTLPRPGHGEQELRDYFVALRSMGYDGRISIEARWSEVKDAAAALDLLRDVWARSEIG